MYIIILYNVDTYHGVWSDMQKEKLKAAEGTYECRLEDGTTIYFSITYDGNGFFECKYPYGASRIGYCHITYEFEYEEYCFEVWLPEDSFDGTKLTKSSHTFFMYDYDKLESMYVDSKLYPLKKISDKAKTKEQYVVEVEEAKRAKFEENKNFHSNDLPAFMLHGKVKTMIETNYDGYYEGIYTFNEKGQLTEAKIGGDYSDYIDTEINHKGNKLILSYHNTSDENGGYGFEDAYEIDKSGRLIFEEHDNYEGYRHIESYSNFNSNGWPTTVAFKSEDGTDLCRFRYSDIDEIGNWTEMAEIYNGEEDGEEHGVHREITYYPADI